MGFSITWTASDPPLIRSCLAIAGGMLVAFAFVDRIADFLCSRRRLRMRRPAPADQRRGQAKDCRSIWISR
jgi:hypothetical protein